MCPRLTIFSLLIVLLVGLVNAAPLPDADLSLQRCGMPSQQLKQALKTGPDQAKFWSGKTNGVSSRLTAQAQAKATGGKTLDMAMKEGGIKIPSKPPPGPKQKIQDQRNWKKPSTIFAQKVQGKVDVYLGKVVKPDSVYNVYEKPALMKNPKVTKITEHSHDGKPNVIKGKREEEDVSTSVPVFLFKKHLSEVPWQSPCDGIK